MKKYSKDNLKKRTLSRALIVLLVIIIVICLAVAIYILIQKNYIYEKIDDNAKFVSDDVAKNSMPVIIDNVLVGGVYQKKWVDVSQFYAKSINKSDMEIDVYTKDGKKGTYDLSSISQGSSSTIYSAITDVNLIDEYFAISKSDTNICLIPATKRTQIIDEDVKYVEKALGFLRLFNTTVKVNESYDVTLSQGKFGRIICATNQVGKSMGAYSVVVYVDESNKTHLVKYNYIKDKENASDWPIYSFKFTGDFNLDGVNEIVICETKEFEIKYDILEYRNGKFYEVLSSVIK